MKEHVREVEIVDPRVVRFHLKEPWPDFMTFYGTTASAAGIVVPKKYLSAVGDEGFKQHPVGAGPYKFVSSKPGVEVELAAFPAIGGTCLMLKTLVMRSVPDATTRALMLRSGEADMAYALDGVDAEGIQADPNLKVVATKHASSQWIEFTEQWDPKSPWHDKRLRLAVNYALDRAGDQQGRMSRVLPARGRDRAPGHGIRAAGPADAVRSAKGQAVARRSRLSQWA